MLTVGEIEWARWGGDEYVTVQIPLEKLQPSLRDLLCLPSTECLKRDEHGVLQIIRRPRLNAVPMPHALPPLPHATTIPALPPLKR